MYYFGYNFDRKSTKETWIVAARSVILRPDLRPLLKPSKPLTWKNDYNIFQILFRNDG